MTHLHPPPSGFVLLDGSGVPLYELPGTTRIDTPLGRADPYTWERAPFSSQWFPLGDGLPSGPPRLTLAGSWEFETADEAMSHAAQMHRATRLARSVQWRGRHLATLRSDYPGTCQCTHNGEVYRLLTYSITLNLTAELTPESLMEAQQR